jgi:hypothetical protein
MKPTISHQSPGANPLLARDLLVPSPITSMLWAPKLAPPMRGSQEVPARR